MKKMAIFFCRSNTYICIIISVGGRHNLRACEMNSIKCTAIKQQKQRRGVQLLSETSIYPNTYFILEQYAHFSGYVLAWALRHRAAAISGSAPVFSHWSSPPVKIPDSKNSCPFIFSTEFLCLWPCFWGPLKSELGLVQITSSQYLGTDFLSL